MFQGVPPRNSMLAALPAGDWALMCGSFQETELRQGEVLLEPGQAFSHVHFPVQGVVSAVARFQNGASAEMATIGSEGLVGLGVVLGSRRALARHVVQIAGRAL